jgi:hypothetical protein
MALSGVDVAVSKLKDVQSRLSRLEAKFGTPLIESVRVAAESRNYSERCRHRLSEAALARRGGQQATPSVPSRDA